MSESAQLEDDDDDDYLEWISESPEKAAASVERLEAENKRLKADRKEYLAAPCVCQFEAENERLRKEIASIARLSQKLYVSQGNANFESISLALEALLRPASPSPEPQGN